MGRDPEYGDDFVAFHPTAAQVASGFDVGIRFTVTREEYVALRNGAAASLSPPTPATLQKGEPLNCFTYPHAEINGQPVQDLKRTFSFRQVSASPQSAAGR
jgi:hypothetical protein